MRSYAELERISYAVLLGTFALDHISTAWGVTIPGLIEGNINVAGVSPGTWLLFDGVCMLVIVLACKRAMSYYPEVKWGPYILYVPLAIGYLRAIIVFSNFNLIWEYALA